MRTPEQWAMRVRPTIRKRLFPPRLQQDLLDIPEPDLPDIGTGLYLYGPAGSGKTVLSGFLLLHQHRQWYLESNDQRTSKFVSVPEMFQELKDCFSPGATQTEREVLGHYQGLDLLVLDDFGVTRPSDWILQTTYLLVNYRYEHLLPTIYTSNRDLPGLEDLFGDDRITSRIERSCQIKLKRKFSL